MIFIALVEEELDHIRRLIGLMGVKLVSWQGQPFAVRPRLTASLDELVERPLAKMLTQR